MHFNLINDLFFQRAKNMNDAYDDEYYDDNSI